MSALSSSPSATWVETPPFVWLLTGPSLAPRPAQPLTLWRLLKRRARLATALAVVVSVLSPARPASAAPVTMTWTGEVVWYNGDWLSLCQESNFDPAGGCDFWLTLASYGIDISSYSGSTTPLRFSMTFDDAMPNQWGAYETLASTHLEFGRLSITSHGAPFIFDFSGESSGPWGPDVPVLFPDLGAPRGIQFYGFPGAQPRPGSSLSAAVLQQPPNAFATTACISIGGDCDLFAIFTSARVRVPEVSTVLLLLPASLIAGWRRYRRVRR